MEITQTMTDQVQVAFVCEDGPYTFMGTLVRPLAAIPEEEAIRKCIEAAFPHMAEVSYVLKEQPDAKSLAAESEAQYAAWRKIMDTPVPEPTKAELEAQLVRAHADKAAAVAAADKRIADLTAAVAVADAEAKG